MHGAGQHEVLDLLDLRQHSRGTHLDGLPAVLQARPSATLHCQLGQQRRCGARVHRPVVAQDVADGQTGVEASTAGSSFQVAAHSSRGHQATTSSTQHACTAEQARDRCSRW